MINNSDIIKFSSDSNQSPNFSFELKENLLEHYDFVALPKKVYKLFKLWYDVDFELVRYLKPDLTQNNKMMLDLYPGTTLPNFVFNNFSEKNSKDKPPLKGHKKNRVQNNLIMKNYKSSISSTINQNSNFLNSDASIFSKNKPLSPHHQHTNTHSYFFLFFFEYLIFRLQNILK